MSLGAVEVGPRVVEVICKDTGAYLIALDGQAVLENDGLVYLGCEFAEGFLHVLQVSVNVQVVGVHGSDDCDVGMELQERTVELVGLCHDGGVVAHQKIGAVVLGNAAQECGASVARFGKNVGDERGCGGLAVGAGYCKAGLVAGYFAQRTGALDYFVSVGKHELHLRKLGRHGGRVNHQRGRLVGGDARRIVLVVDSDALGLEARGERRGSAVVARYLVAAEFVPPCDGTHSYSAYSEEIDILEFSFRHFASIL